MNRYYSFKTLLNLIKPPTGLGKLLIQFWVSLNGLGLICYVIADSAITSPSTLKAAGIWSLIAAWFVWNLFNVINYIKRTKEQ